MKVEKSAHNDESKDKFDIEDISRGEWKCMVEALEVYVSSKNIWNRKGYLKVLNALYEGDEE